MALNVLFGDARRTSSALELHVQAREGSHVTAKVVATYWLQPGVPDVLSLDTRIEYLSKGGTWGRVFPEVGQTIVAFIARFADGTYAETIHHVRVEGVGSAKVAVLLYMPLPLPGLPAWLSSEVRLHPQLQVPVVPYAAFQRYLGELGSLSPEA